MEIVKLCLKHFRQQGYFSAFKELQQQTNVQLEDPKMSELHDLIVCHGDFKRTENIMEELIDDGFMDNYISKQDYSAVWKLQPQLSTEFFNHPMAHHSKANHRPGMRGGHQLIIDCERSLMYLFGGWDGSEDLSDLWMYDIKNKKWELLHEKSELEEGPSPRSCHKMVYDPVNSQIFTLGRYIEVNSRSLERLKVSDLCVLSA